MSEVKLSGKHVFWLLAGFFGATIAANAVFISVAVKSFPGVVTEEPFLEGLRYNQKLAAKRAQRDLGWRASLTASHADKARFELSFVDAGGKPIRGLVVDGVLRRPASDGDDVSFTFSEFAGRYVADAVEAPPGAWNFEASASAATGETFEIRQRIILP